MHFNASQSLSHFKPMIRNPLIAILILLSPLASFAAALTTHAERTHFQQTGRYDEVISLCAAFQKAHPKAVRCITFGTTPEGRPMKALVATHANAFTPNDARKKNLPVLLVQGGIHAGEIDGNVQDVIFTPIGNDATRVAALLSGENRNDLRRGEIGVAHADVADLRRFRLAAAREIAARALLPVRLGLA